MGERVALPALWALVVVFTLDGPVILRGASGPAREVPALLAVVELVRGGTPDGLAAASEIRRWLASGEAAEVDPCSCQSPSGP